MIPLSFLLRRLRYRWPRLLVVSLGVLLATSLLASAPLLVEAVITLGLQQALQATDPLTGNLRLSLHSVPDPVRVEALDARVRAAVVDTLGPLNPQVIRSIESAGLLPWVDGELVTDERITVRFYEELEAHTSLAAGAWPAVPQPADTSVADPVIVVISEAMGDAYDLDVGAEVFLARQRSETEPVTSVVVNGILRATTRPDPYWFGIYGPLQPYHDGNWTAEHNVFVADGTFYGVVDRLLPRANLTLSWHVILDPEAIAHADIGSTRAVVETLRQDLMLGEPRILMDTALDEMLATYERQMTIIRAPLMLITAEIVILALYYVVMVAALVTRQTESEYAVLGSRGASRRQVLAMQAVEACALAAAAFVSGPWLGVLLVRSLGWVGPLADLTIGAWVLTPSRAAWIAAAVGAGASFLGLLLPIGPALRRSIVAQQQTRIRRVAPPWWQRMYLDVFALALGIVLLWRLQLYGSLVGGSAARPEVDWLLLLSPLALLLGSATILLRIFPLMLQILAAVAARGRGLSVPLSLWPSARDPSHVARLVLLLTLAMALGILATGLNATLDLSESERAAYAVGGDLKLTVRDVLSAFPMSTASGIETIASAWRAIGTVATRAPYPRFEMLAIDPQKMQTLALYRDDFAEQPIPTLLETLILVEAPSLADISMALDLPGRPAGIDLWVWAPPDALAGLPSSIADTVAGNSNHERIRITAKLGTAEGTYVIVELDPVSSDVCASRCWGNQACDPERPWAGISSYDCRWVRFSGQIPELGEHAYPLTLASLWFRNQTYMQLRRGRQAVRDVVITVAIDEIAVSDRTDGALTVVEDFEIPDRIWMTTAGSNRYRATGGHSDPSRQDLILTFSRGTSTIGFSPYSGSALQPIPVLVSHAFAETTQFEVGDTFHGWVASLPDLTFRVAGTLNYFPTLYENRETELGTLDAGFVVASTEEVLKQLNQYSRRAINPNELWMTLDETDTHNPLGDIPGITEVLVRDEVRQALKAHPMALGLRSVTFFGYVLTSVLSLIGFGTYFTMSAQQRATMYGILRSMGLSSLQLYGSLVLEQALLIVWGLGLGMGLGAILNRLVLPGLPISLGDVPPVPPFIPQDDWMAVGRLTLVLAGAFILVLGIGTLILWRTRLHRALRIGEE